MMSGVSYSFCRPDKAEYQSTGLTPFLTMEQEESGRFVEQTSTSSMTSDSRRQSEGAADSSAGPSILSPNGVFNFSPSPMAGVQSDNKTSDPNMVWATAYNAGNATTLGCPMTSDGLQPSTRTEGPWRGVETVDSAFATTGAKYDRDGIPLEQPPLYPPNKAEGSGDSFTVLDNLDASVPDEVLQQRILMDLFWPGWPPNLPEPNIVNDL